MNSGDDQDYRDRRVERQRRRPEALFRRLATLPIFEFSHFRMLYLRYSFFWRGSKISVEAHQMYLYHMSKKSRPSLHNWRHCFAFSRYLLNLQCNTPNSVPNRVQTYQNIFVYESSNYEHLSETILYIRDAKWSIYFECLSTLLSL